MNHFLEFKLLALKWTLSTMNKPSFKAISFSGVFLPNSSRKGKRHELKSTVIIVPFDIIIKQKNIN